MISIIINPPVNKSIYSKYSFSAPILPPIGLLSIAANIKEKGYKTILIDAIADKKSSEEVIKEIEKKSPNIVCLTATSATWNSAKKIITEIKKQKDKPNKLITILGGSHVSAHSKSVMKECPDLDFGVIGEGELTIKELLSSLENKNKELDVNGIIYRKNNDIIITKPRELIKDLDEIPMPAFELVGTIKKYSHTPLRVKRKFFSLVTSRGCNYNCSFCDQTVFGSKWRANSPIRVLEMIQKVKKLYNVKFISFEDDNFGVSKSRVIEICKLILKNNLKIKWGCSMHINSINEDMIKWMKKAGCWIIYTGIESGSERILDKVNKKTTIKSIEEKVSLIKKHKIKVYGSFIIGFLDETKEEIEQTKKLALKLNLDGASFFTYTDFLKENKNTNKKHRDNWDRYSTHNANPMIFNKNLTKKYLLAKQQELYKEFYLRPSYAIKQVDRLTDINFLKKGIQYIIKQAK